jgi:hypothetical protein
LLDHVHSQIRKAVAFLGDVQMFRPHGQRYGAPCMSRQLGLSCF